MIKYEGNHWEYKIEEKDEAYPSCNGIMGSSSFTVKILNKMGQDGWELCGVTARSNGSSDSWVYYFKREL